VKVFINASAGDADACAQAADDIAVIDKSRATDRARKGFLLHRSRYAAQCRAMGPRNIRISLFAIDKNSNRPAFGQRLPLRPGVFARRRHRPIGDAGLLTP
jgi:hypothetical protein